MFMKYYTFSNIIIRHESRAPLCTYTILSNMELSRQNRKKEKRKEGEQKDTHEYLTYSRTRLRRQSKTRRWRRQVREGDLRRVARGARTTFARSWFSGNRQRSGAIKRVICVLQFDPAALGAVRRDRRVIYANSWASGICPARPDLLGSLFAPDATTSSFACVPCAASDATPVVDGHQADGVHARSIVSPILR